MKSKHDVVSVVGSDMNSCGVKSDFCCFELLECRVWEFDEDAADWISLIRYVYFDILPGNQSNCFHSRVCLCVCDFIMIKLSWFFFFF